MQEARGELNEAMSLRGIAHDELGETGAAGSAFQRFLPIARSRFDAQKQEITRRLQGRQP